MKKITTLILSIFFILEIFAQSFAPQINFAETTAIHKDSSIIIDWASGVKVQRGVLNLSEIDSELATYGEDKNALGKAEGNPKVVSLGNKGEAILTFDKPISNGKEADFVVFENGFLKNDTSRFAFLEFAFVEVSSDGENFVRFPAVSENQIDKQFSSFEATDCRYIHNLAGKYTMFYGTPFDLDDLKTVQNSDILNLNKITHVKIIDVGGSINNDFASYDSEGNIINDPYPTPFISAGFDLDAVGVINNIENTVSCKNCDLRIYPNPCSHTLYYTQNFEVEYIEIFSNLGLKVLDKKTTSNKLDISNLSTGIYFVKFHSENKIIIKKIVKL